MIFSFFAVKILLSLITAFFITQKSIFVVVCFFIFILIDILDGKLLGPKYRPFDTTSDRIFVYLGFIAFLYSNHNAYPTIIFMISFAIRDGLLIARIIHLHDYYLNSITLDKITMLLAAVYFAFQASGINYGSVQIVEILSFLVSSLILYQGIDKLKRIRGKANERLLVSEEHSS